MDRVRKLKKTVETTYEVSEETFKKALGLPNSKELSWVWFGGSGENVEIKIKEGE